MMVSDTENNSTPVHYRKNRWKIFFLVAVSIFMSTLDSSIVNVALPFMMEDLSTDIHTIQWVVLVYLTTVSSLLMTFGRISDIRGRKPVYIFGFLVFAAGSLFCGLASAPWVLIAARAVQGSGAAMLMACSPAIIADVFPARERGRALGIIGAVVASGLTTGPVAGGFLLEYTSWRYIFYINIPIGAAAAAWAFFLLDDLNLEGSERPDLDKGGSILLIVALASLILFLTHLSKTDLLSMFNLGAGTFFILAGAGFVWLETRVKDPLFDLDLLRIRLFIYPVAASAILFAALFVIVFLMPFYLIYPCGFSAAKTGAVMIVPFLFLLFVSPLSGMFYDRWGSRKICLLGMTSMACAHLSLITLSPGQGTGAILWRVALAGLATALFVSPNTSAIMNSVAIRQRGVASGAVATARNLGMVIGVALAGLVFNRSFASLTSGMSLENYLPHMAPVFMISFDRVMVMGAGLSMAGLVVTFVRGKERPIEKKKEKQS